MTYVKILDCNNKNENTAGTERVYADYCSNDDTLNIWLEDANSKTRLVHIAEFDAKPFLNRLKMIRKRLEGKGADRNGG